MTFGLILFTTIFVSIYAQLFTTTTATSGNNHAATTTFSNSTNSSSQQDKNASLAPYLGYHYEYNFY
jgi:hypothetical protein